METLISRDIRDMNVRWQQALDYIEQIDMDHLPEEHAVRVLMRRDFPRLIRELTRIRPELNAPHLDD